MILLRSFLSGHIRIKRTLEYYDAGIGPRVPFGGGGGAVSPIVSSIFASELGDYTTLSTTSTMPTGGSITRAGNAMLYDSTGKLTYAPNNLLTYSGDPSQANGGPVSAGSTTTANYSISPDGTQDAGRIQMTATGNYAYKRVTTGQPGNYVFSIWLKAASNQTIWARFAPQSGSATYVACSVTTSWQQFYVAGSVTGAGYIDVGLDNRSAVVGGDDAAKDVQVWAYVVANVTYETSPRTADGNPNSSGIQQLNAASAYYGPRFDYNPVTLAAKGLLVEGTRTNILTGASNFTAQQGSLTLNSNTSPDGTSNGNTFTEDTTNNFHRVYNTVSISTFTTYTISAYLKKGTRNYAFISGTDGAAVYATAVFDLNLGLLGETSAVSYTINGTSITSIGNGWYRCSLTFTTAGAGGSYVTVGTASAASGNTFVGSGSPTFTGTSSTIFWYGVQTEAGAFPTSYIPTTSGSLARAAESFTLANYTNRLVESFYIDEETGGSWSANIAPSATSPLTIGTPTFGWVTSLRPYTNAYAGDITTPTWIDNSGTTGNRMYYDSTGALTWAPANTLTYSEDFRNTTDAGSTRPWVYSTAAVTPNAATAPDGQTTADLLYPTSSSVYAGAVYYLSTSGEVLSVYAKKAGLNFLCIYNYNAATGAAWFNLNTGSVGTVSGGYTAAMTPVSGYPDWYRCSLKTNGAPFSVVEFQACSADNSVTPTASGTNGIYIWGAQLERVTYQTSPRAYIPTTTAAVYQPRYDYDPSVTPATPRGMLIEEGRTNRSPASLLTDASWTVSGTNLPKYATTTGPDGISNSAQTFQASLGSSYHFTYQTASISISSGSNYTYSVYAKAGTTRYVHINFMNASQVYVSAVFDVGANNTSATQTAVGSTSGTIVSTSQQYVGNGWYRISLTGSVAASTIYIEMGIAGAATGNTFFIYGEATFSANGTETVSFYGAQIEAGSFPTSYIPTTTASVTRVADVVKLSGSALTTLQGAAASVVQEQNIFGLNAYSNTISAAVGSTDKIAMYLDSGTGLPTAQFGLGYNGTSILPTSIGDLRTTFRTGFSFNASNGSCVINGGTVATSAIAYASGITSARFGQNYNGSSFCDMWVRSIALYNQRIPDTTLKSKSIVGSTY
jgi:hypothetical protein